ncbi:MAG TPA: PEGA domain-containing protein [Deinococcales bacterium]|nr:PEGA domain-containing protein [Deinococcales bacterium]
MNLKLVSAVASVFALTLGAAGAQRITPQSIIVNPNPPADLRVDVRVNKAGENPVYRPGEAITITASVTQDAYVYLFYTDPNGVDVIFPNQFDRNNLMRAGETRSFGGAGNYRFSVGSTGTGQNSVIAVASRTQLDPQLLRSQLGYQTNAQGTVTVTVTNRENLARALSIVIEPVQQQNWVSDEAFFWVEPVAAQPAQVNPTISFGNLPQGAQVFVDGQFIGRAPVTFTAAPGQHTLRVVAEGYRDFTGTFTVRAGQNLTVPVQLQAIPRTGTLVIRANIAGAVVYLNGNRAGQISGNGTLSVANLNSGSYEVTIVAPGYRTYVSDVNVQGGQTINLTATLRR